MSRFWKIVLLVVAVLVVGFIGLRLLSGGKHKGEAAAALPAPARTATSATPGRCRSPWSTPSARTCRCMPAHWAP